MGLLFHIMNLCMQEFVKNLHIKEELFQSAAVATAETANATVTKPSYTHSHTPVFRPLQIVP